MRTDGKLSVYKGIVERIKRDIALGIIAQGERLPSCREFAIELGINPNTVQRAYAELESEGLIFTIPKKGVYAGKQSAPDSLKVAEEQLRAMKSAGVTKSQLQSIIEKVFSED